MNIITNFEKIKQEIKNNLPQRDIKVIAVSKTFSLEHIMPLVQYGHKDFGENKVQEAEKKWTVLKKTMNNLSLHMIGRLQSNKAKKAVEIFDYIHSLDNLKLAKKLAKEIREKNKKIKLFIQINLGDEKQKSGIEPSQLESFYQNCSALNLDIVGTMCIPPVDQNTKLYFKSLYQLNQKFNFQEISMGMTNDYLDAVEYKSTFLRVGTGIFGKRSN